MTPMKWVAASLFFAFAFQPSVGFSQFEEDFETELEAIEQDSDMPLDEPSESFFAPEEERPAGSLAPVDSGFPASTNSSFESAPPAPGSFVKPKGPPGGGVIEAPHPAAAKGLLKIEKDGSYIYRTPLPEKSRSTSLRVGFLTTPLITNNQGVSFGDIYGADGLIGLVGEYEWQPFRRFGMLGIQLGSGLVVARGNGRFADGALAEEIYNLVVAPLSAQLVYRFEYVRRQWAVPFISGGGAMYGLVEFRDDGKPPVLAMAPAVVAGGGLHINISRWDPKGSFILAQDYHVADLWLTIEGKVVQGLDQELDMTNQTVSAGFTVDF